MQDMRKWDYILFMLMQLKIMNKKEALKLFEAMKSYEQTDFIYT